MTDASARLAGRMIDLAKALNISAGQLAESLAKRLMPAAEKCLAAGAWGVAIVAIPRQDGEGVDLGIALPSKDGKIKLPRKAELVLAFTKTDETHAGNIADFPILHDDWCQTLTTGLMGDCRCNPEIGPPAIAGSALEAN